MKKVYSCRTKLEADLVKGKLEAGGIKALIKGALIELHPAFGEPSGSIEIWVDEQDVDSAEKILIE